MAINAQNLRDEVNGTEASVSTELANNCISVADELLKQYAGADYKTDIPTTVAEKAWLAVAVEIFNQRKAPNGILNQAYTNDGGAYVQAVRIGSDPLRPAYGLLSRWVTDLGFA